MDIIGKLKSIWESYPCQRLMKSCISTLFVTIMALMQEDVRYMYLIPVIEVIRGMIFKHFNWNLDK